MRRTGRDTAAGTAHPAGDPPCRREHQDVRLRPRPREPSTSGNPAPHHRGGYTPGHARTRGTGRDTAAGTAHPAGDPPCRRGHQDVRLRPRPREPSTSGNPAPHHRGGYTPGHARTRADRAGHGGGHGPSCRGPALPTGTPGRALTPKAARAQHERKPRPAPSRRVHAWARADARDRAGHGGGHGPSCRGPALPTGTPGRALTPKAARAQHERKPRPAPSRRVHAWARADARDRAGHGGGHGPSCRGPALPTGTPGRALTPKAARARRDRESRPADGAHRSGGTARGRRHA